MINLAAVENKKEKLRTLEKIRKEKIAEKENIEINIETYNEEIQKLKNKLKNIIGQINAYENDKIKIILSLIILLAAITYSGMLALFLGPIGGIPILISIIYLLSKSKKILNLLATDKNQLTQEKFYLEQLLKQEQENKTIMLSLLNELNLNMDGIDIEIKVIREILDNLKEPKDIRFPKYERDYQRTRVKIVN